MINGKRGSEVKGKYAGKVTAGVLCLTAALAVFPAGKIQAQAAKAAYTYVSESEEHFAYSSDEEKWFLNDTKKTVLLEDGRPDRIIQRMIDKSSGEVLYSTVEKYKYKKNGLLKSITVKYENTDNGADPVLDKQTFSYYKSRLLKKHVTENPGIGKETEKYTYNKKKKLAKITITFDDGTKSTVKITYKGKKPVKLTRTLNSGDASLRYTETYDKKGRVKKKENEEILSSGSTRYVMKYSYNKYGYESKHTYQGWENGESAGKTTTKFSYKYYTIEGKKYIKQVTEKIDGKKISKTVYSKPVKVSANSFPWDVYQWYLGKGISGR